jgi:hypothetical protein
VAAAAPPATPSDAGPVRPAGTSQDLYLDTSTLNRRSLKFVADAVSGQIDRILKVGPLEIVVADATPRVFLAATSDPVSLRSALKDLAANVPGKERLLDLRRDALRELRNAQAAPGGSRIGSGNPAASRVRSLVQSAAGHEIALLRVSFDRLEAWASARPEGGAGILYYSNDGFDMDPVETYERSVTSGDVTVRQEILQMQAEYGGEVEKMLKKLEATLAGKGLTTVPIALGTTSAEMANSAGNMELRGASAMRQVVDFAPLFFYERPTEPLRLVADATGGEVVTTSSRFGSVLDRIGSAYVVTFRVRAVPDGRPHPLAVSSTRPGVTVRASHHLLTGRPSAISAERAARVLEGSERPADVPVLATLVPGGSAPPGKRGGMLRLAVNFASAAEVLDFENPTKIPLRVSVAVAIDDADPFTSSEEIDWVPEGTSWRYQFPMIWPSDARRIAILVEEMSTGLSGAAVVDVPAP